MVVTASSMQIKGSFDSGSIVTGLDRMKSGLKEVGKFGKSVHADMIRMVNAGSRLTSILAGVGLAGTGSFLALAKGAPAVAPSVAKITVETERLKRALGTSLKPVFEWFSDKYTNFVNWVESHPDLFRGFVLTGAALSGVLTVSKLIDVLTTGVISASVLKLIKTLTTGAVSSSILSALGYLAGIGAAAYVSYKGASVLLDKLRRYTGMGTNPNAPTDMSGQTLLNRLPQKLWSSITGNRAPWQDVLNPNSPAHYSAIQQIKSEGYRQTPGGTISASTEQDRKFALMMLWDSIWS